ncbi:MAG TPA: riboflavin synthase [Chthoniobacterales bacterium]|jgi:riboflavin synthase|nr:riboflavin synthase [Chthoniobacterales bacterium]
MFTGLIEEVGRVAAFHHEGDLARLEIDALRIAGKTALGDSVAVNGCCLTVSARTDSVLTFDLLGETLLRTNLQTVGVGSAVNLERAIAAGAPLGGHFVQGHVDCAAPILSIGYRGADLRVEVALTTDFSRYVISKGSIAVNGISLTVAEVSEKSLAVWIIPHTREQTNIGSARAGHLVNLEFDLLAKYVERMLDRPKKDPA